MVPLRLLGRQGCGLCEEMHEALHAFGRGFPLPAIVEVDVDADPELQRRYGLRVPVLLWGEAIVCEARLDEAELRRMLRNRGD